MIERLQRLHARFPLGPDLLAFCLLLLLLHQVLPTSVTHLHISSPKRQPVTVPFTFKQGVMDYTFEGVLWRHGPRPGSLDIRADDCVTSLRVDGIETFHSACNTYCEHCIHTRFLLPETLAPGPHRLLVQVHNQGSLGLFDLWQARGFDLSLLAICLAAGVLWAALLTWRRKGRAAFWPVCGGLLLAMVYFLATDPWERQHDGWAHRQYIEILLVRHALPLLKEGWETWQPPLYYVLASLWIQLGALISRLESWRFLQLLALLCYVSSLALLAFHWDRFAFPRRSAWLGPVLLACLPASLFLSARINNDVLMPVLGGLVLIGLWLSSVAFSGLVLLLAMMTKPSSVSLVAAAALYLSWRDHLEGRPLPERLKRLILLGLPSAMWLALWVCYSWRQTGWLMYYDPHMWESMRVQNSFLRFFSFDFRSILAEGQLVPTRGLLRQSWPTSVFVSVLLGEYDWNSLPFPPRPAFILSFLPIGLLLLAGIFRPAERNRIWLASLLLVACHTLFMLYFVIRHPYGCNQNARYWAAVYLPLAVLVTSGYEACLRALPRALRVLLFAALLPFFVLLGFFYYVLVWP